MTSRKSGRVLMSIYVPPAVKKMLHMESLRRDTYLQYIGEEALIAYIKFLKKAELEDRKQRKLSIEAQEKELEKIQSLMDDCVKLQNEHTRFGIRDIE